MDLEELYSKNENFRAYVDNGCRTGRYTKEEFLKHKITYEVAAYYERLEGSDKHAVQTS